MVATRPPPRNSPRLAHEVAISAINHLALVVGDDDAVGIAVEGNANVGTQLAHLVAHDLGVRGPAAFIDVYAVGLVADLDHFGAQFPQRSGRNLVGRAIGGIDDHA